MDLQGADYLKSKQWSRALEVFNKLLQNPKNSENEIISHIIQRSKCLYELGNHEVAINECKHVLKTFNGKYNELYEPHVRFNLIRSLFAINRAQEAEMVIKEWLMLMKQLNSTTESKIQLEATLDKFFGLITRQDLEAWFDDLNMKINQPTGNNMQNDNKIEIFCIYCNIAFNTKSDLLSHCTTQEHESMIMSDDGRDWHWRAPPRGIKSNLYNLCENFIESGNCKFGLQCIDAHGEAELNEWKERFQYREMKLMRAKDKELYGKSYTEELLEKWAQASNPGTIMRENLDQIEDSCTSPLSATVLSKNSKHEWKFTLKSATNLHAIALLQDTHRSHFYIDQIATQRKQFDVTNKQEFINQPQNQELDSISNIYEVIIVFKTTIFGTFRQSVIFDFGSSPVLVKHLCVDVIPDSDLAKLDDIRREVSLSISERWTCENSRIIQFKSDLINTSSNSEWETNLKSLYSCPQNENFVISNLSVSDKKFSRNNYREKMHELLWIEEIARYNLVARYNLTAKLQVAHSYLLAPNSTAASTAKYSSNGELFASMNLTKELSEDTCEGRLILMHCSSVYIKPLHETEDIIYEALIEDKGKNMIYLRISAETVKALNLTPDALFEAQIQFQLNRIPYCEWHYAIDKIRDYRLLFPEIYVEPIIPWSPSRQWCTTLDQRLNVKQKEAVVAITTPLFVKLPPILVIGPFGTGKTFTLAQAVKELIKDEGNKILLCTHSNSAADLYIKDYFDLWVENGDENARPLRIYYQKRWVTTVSPVVQKYCKITSANRNLREFQIPTLEDIEKHKIIVVTLSTSIYLSAAGLLPGVFTHILIDEAAQALECEAITPLCLATENTRIVLAGDHMQLGPDIFSQFAKQRNLHISLLERLYYHYPSNFSCKILLCENYRAHESIIQFTSESFYEQKLISSSKQPKHNKFYPLTFFTTRGEDVQDKNSTAFYNNSEVYEVVDRVADLKRNWPSEWGELNEQSIGVVTPYADQVFRIRSELRKRRLDVCVERVLNVQGKQFRVVVLSTVRTRNTCGGNDKKTNDSGGSGELDFGFLSNSKLLNTAITRAQSLVAVVGDPIALCSIGRCSKVWERFIEICNSNSSLFGITWSDLKFQLDGIELKKIYTLNPLAPEFIPRRYKEMMQQANNYSRPVYQVPLLYQQRPIALATNYIVQPNVGLAPSIGLNGYRAPDISLVIPPRIPFQQQPIAAHQHLNKTPPTSTNPKLIQFMNNVHFPEAHVLNDCVSLLPLNMSLAEMLQQPPNIQERWYNYLKSSAGIEVAEKFKYLLHATNQKGSRVADTTLLARGASRDSPTFNWYDSPTNQINFNKPIYVKELEAAAQTSDARNPNPLYKRQSQNDLRRHINEDFANLGINNGLDDVFKAFSDNRQSQSRVEALTGPRFYKYFS